MFTLPLDAAISELPCSVLTISVADQIGNRHEVKRAFAIGPGGAPVISNAHVADDGSFRFDFDGEPQSKRWIEHSPDTTIWTPISPILDFSGRQKAVNINSSSKGFFRLATEPE